MTKIKNLKISQKLFLSYIITSILLTTMGIFGLINIGIINTNSERMHDEMLLSISQLKDIESNIMVLRGDLISLTYAKEQADINTIMESMKTVNMSNKEEIEEFSKHKFSEENQIVFDEFSLLYMEYDSIIQKLDQAAKDGKASAIKSNTYNAQVKYMGLSNALNKLISNFEVEVKALSDENSKRYSTSIAFTSLVMIISIFLSVLLGFIMSRYISIRLKKVGDLADRVGKGDLTYKIEVQNHDEFGLMSESLNRAVDNVKLLVSNLMEQIQDMSASSEELSATSEELLATMENINNNTQEITEGAGKLSTSYEEIGASTEEIESTIEELASKAEEGDVSSRNIQVRAKKIKTKGIESAQTAKAMYQENSDRINGAIKASKVVEQIDTMADAISQIASQTNLLSLNAAIEAARAGEHGKGFAVVAMEIRNLADGSADAAKNIKEITGQVKKSFENFINSSEQILSFINNIVNPDYEQFVEIGELYERDAETFGKMANELMVATKEIAITIKDVNASMQNVSETADQSAANTDEISNSIYQATAAVNEVAKATQIQSVMAENINELVRKFQI